MEVEVLRLPAFLLRVRVRDGVGDIPARRRLSANQSPERGRLGREPEAGHRGPEDRHAAQGDENRRYPGHGFGSRRAPARGRGRASRGRTGTPDTDTGEVPSPRVVALKGVDAHVQVVLVRVDAGVRPRDPGLFDAALDLAVENDVRHPRVLEQGRLQVRQVGAVHVVERDVERVAVVVIALDSRVRGVTAQAIGRFVTRREDGVDFVAELEEGGGVGVHDQVLLGVTIGRTLFARTRSRTRLPLL